MNVQELMETPMFQSAKIVAGNQGMTNRVLSVNMMDAPDIIDFLKPHELLLTTAYAIRDDIAAMEGLVSKMAKHNCAGLGIKTKRFVIEIPQSVLDIANDLHFPIIELPLEYSLGELVAQSLGIIMEKKTEQLRYALETHRSFSDIVMRGKGIPEIIESLSALLHEPIFLWDHKPSRSAKSSHFRDAQFSEIAEALSVMLHDAVKPGDKGFTLCIISKGHLYGKEIMLHPISPNQQQYLIIFGAIAVEQSQLLLAVEQAANVIGFELVKRQALDEKSRRYKNDFFTDVIEGNIQSELEILNRGKIYGLTAGSHYFCAIGKVDDLHYHFSFQSGQSTEERFHATKDNIYDLIKSAWKSTALQSVLFTKNDLYVLLIASSPQHIVSELNLTQSLQKVQERIYHQLKLPMSFGIGTLARGVFELPESYQEAADALKMGYTERKSRFIQPFRTKKVIDMLRLIPASDLQDFSKQSLQRLLETDEKERHMLMQTLYVFLENNCQISETAKKLYIHRNTVMYRLTKCENLIGRSIKDPDETLRLRIALLLALES